MIAEITDHKTKLVSDKIGLLLINFIPAINYEQRFDVSHITFPLKCTKVENHEVNTLCWSFDTSDIFRNRMVKRNRLDLKLLPHKICPIFRDYYFFLYLYSTSSC